MWYKDLAAGTLGYITGNIKGAKKAIALSRLHTKMAPIPRSKKRKFNKALKFPSKRRTVFTNQSIAKAMSGSTPIFPRRKKKPTRRVTKTHPINEIGSKTFTVVLNKRRPKHNKAQWNYIQSHPVVMGSAAGLQDVNDILSMGTISQLEVSTGLGYNAFQNHTAVQQLNPYLSTTGSTLYPSQAIPLTDRFVLKTYTIKTEFTSWTNIVQTGWIYYLTPKTDNQTRPTSAWLAGNVALASGKTQQSFPTAPATTGAIGGESPNMPYATPMTSPVFKQLYKILKVVKIDLPPGATETLNARFIVNKLLKKEEVTQSTTEGNVNLKNTSVYMMGVWLGQVVKYEFGEPVTFTSPVYGQTSVGSISICEYSCAPVDGNAGRLSNAVAVTNIPFNAPAADLDEINDDTGTEQPQVIV